MKLTLSTYEAAERLFNDENSNWTRAGAFALVEYLEELEEDIGEEIEFCPVAVRCDYSQYDSLIEWAEEQWGDLVDAAEALGCDDRDKKELDEAILEFIRDRGTLLEFEGGIIVSSF